MNLATDNIKMERIIVYIDGFNLYFGMLEAGLINCKWLNLFSLSSSLIKGNQALVSIKYFTSRVSNNPEKQKRQSLYLEALESVGVKIIYGHFQKDKIECKRCLNTWPSFNEKMTDVNIATHMLTDAYQDNFDMAMLVSGDSDLVPPISSIHRHFHHKRVCVVFPPKRFNNSVALVSKGSFILGRKKLIDHQFPNELKKSNGYVLKKPSIWE